MSTVGVSPTSVSSERTFCAAQRIPHSFFISCVASITAAFLSQTERLDCVTRRRYAGLLAQAFVCLFLASCDSEILYTDLRVYENPYRHVDWDSAVPLKAQHHDHVAGKPERIRAYDLAGYHVVSLMDYGGNSSMPHALKHRVWPPEEWVPESLRTQLNNIQLFIPNMEEVGLERQHATSPFLEVYIEGGSTDQSFQYRSISEMFSLIRLLGGFPCLAHPWDGERYQALKGPFCTEIYSAFAEGMRRSGEPYFMERDRNQVLVQTWDAMLMQNQKVYGISVNDHFGPYHKPGAIPEDVKDSGKIIVVTNDPPQGYRKAFEEGAIFAVRDLGSVKDQYPAVRRIAVDEESITIDTDGTVRWIVHGAEIERGYRLLLANLPPNSRYVRAEISYDGITIVYSQPFIVRPVGDVNGDYRVDRVDGRICHNVQSVGELDELQAAACAARLSSAQ